MLAAPIALSDLCSPPTSTLCRLHFAAMAQQPFRRSRFRGHLGWLGKFCLSAEQLSAASLNFGEIVCDHVVDPVIGDIHHRCAQVSAPRMIFDHRRRESPLPQSALFAELISSAAPWRRNSRSFRRASRITNATAKVTLQPRKNWENPWSTACMLVFRAPAVIDPGTKPAG